MGSDSTTGSNNKQHRVKNNSTPAASSRASSALNSNQSAGFSVRAPELDGAPRLAFGQQRLANANVVAGNSLYQIDSYSSALHSDLKVILKKLTKRDSTTRIRALDECTAFVGSHSIDDVKPFLHSWPNLYDKLALDADRRVREATARLFLALVKLLNKHLAPILKKIIGPWLIAQTDSSKDVMNLSKDAFETTFPNKLESVLHHCQACLLAYVRFNILEQTPEAMSDSRYTTPEDMVSKHVRVVSGSFYILATLIATLSNDKRSVAEIEYNSLFDHPKLWNCSSHDEPNIRFSCYQFIHACLETSPDIIESRLDLVSTTFLAKAFSEKVPWNHTQLWDTLIKLLQKFPITWKLASSKKPLADKLFVFLKNGAYGGVAPTYPCLVTLVQCIPESILAENAYEFFSHFFDSFWKGLGKVNQSFSATLISSYLDCLTSVLTRSKRIPFDNALDLIANAGFQPITHLFFPGRFPETRHKFKPEEVEPIVASFIVKIWTKNGISQSERICFKSKFMDLVVSGFCIDDGATNLDLETESTAMRTPTKADQDHDVFFSRLVSFLVTVNTLSRSEKELDTTAFHALFDTIVHSVTEHTLKYLTKDASSFSYNAFLAKLVSSFSSVLLSDGSASSGQIFKYMNSNAVAMITSNPSSESVLSILATATHLLEFYATSKTESFQEEIQNMWDQFMNAIFTVFDLKLRFKLLHALCIKVGNSGLSKKIETTCKNLDDLVVLTVSEGNPCRSPYAAELVASFLKVSPECSILSDNSIQTVIKTIKKTILTCSLLYLTVADKNAHSVSSQSMYQLLFSIKVLNSVVSPLPILKRQTAQHYFALVSPVVMAILDIGIFHPSTIAKFVWTPQLDADMDESTLINNIIETAKASWEGIMSIVTYTGGQMLRTALKLWMQRWLKSFSDPFHCGSPADFIFEIKTLLGLLSGKELMSVRLWTIEYALQSQSKWIEASLPFSIIDDRLAICDAMYHTLAVTKELTSDDTSMTTEKTAKDSVLYDHDGLCQYAKMILFLIGLIKDNMIESTTDSAWLWIELVRFSIISDDQFRLMGAYQGPKLWSTECAISPNHLTHEIRTLLSNEIKQSQMVLAEQAEEIECLLSSSLHTYDTSMLLVASIHCTFENKTNTLVSPIVRFGYARVFQEMCRLAFSKYLTEPDEYSVWVNILKTLLKSPKYFQCAIALGTALRSSLQSTKFFKKIVKEIMDAICKFDGRAVTDANCRDQVYCLIVSLNVLAVSHAVESQKSDVITVASAEKMLRTIRTWLNTNIPSAQDILKARSASTSLDNSISASHQTHTIPQNSRLDTCIQNHFYAVVTKLQLILIEVGSPGIVMTKFLVDMVHHRLEELAGYALSDEFLTFSDCVLLHSTLLLWHRIRDIASSTDIEWMEMVDIELSISRTCLKLLIAISEKSSQAEKEVDSELSSPMTEIQHLLCELISDLEYGKEYTISVIHPDSIYRMMFAQDTLAQCLAWRMMHQYTIQTVYARSVLIEMGTLKLALQNSETTEDGESHSKVDDEMYGDQLSSLLVAGLLKNVNATLHSHVSFGYLISWIIAFENFENATFQLKLGYMNQLRSLDVVPKLLEYCFYVLGVGVSGVMPFDLTAWDFQSYEIEGFELNSENSLQLLCAHVYWRAIHTVPSLVRIWWLECNNRQLSLGVESFTERYYSPKIVEMELKSAETYDTRDTEALGIRVSMWSCEVTASYTIEDAVLELVIQLPSSYPLRLAQVGSGKGGGRAAGINEARWRAWVLSVSAVMASQNGSIIDALTVFNKNISMHFKGIEDCAICYSVVSAIDRALPNKQCKTCKNQFHGSCLYKWFKSSGQNTCPLCRQPF
ncbi:hypothetical protein O5D80_001092 [Batrachochytrium dendrobatidis]|nr:hypothetical protein O5D80_001092 [Batrachochytrium dendrobatidis]